MYFPDLTPYKYFEEQSSPDLLNVGWLAAKQDFLVGRVPKALLDELFELSFEYVNATRGYQHCHFCSPEVYPIKATRNGKQISLGSAEIRVRGRGGVTYAAPNLIYHYVETHDYLPPAEFVEAVLANATRCEAFS